MSLSPVALAQESALPSAPAPALAPPPLATAPSSQVPGFAAYESCSFPDALRIVERVPLNEGLNERAAETSHGSTVVELEAAERISMGYPDQDFYANLRVEKLAAKGFRAQKATLIEEFNHTLAQSPEGSRNYSLPARKRGFEIYGLDRNRLGGGVLGIYLFFDDLNRIATTIYFLNQDAATRPFQTMEQYAKLRDQFLDSYTACVRKNQGVPVQP